VSRGADQPRRFGIIGAGCAGLSLATELLEWMPGAHVTVVDPRTSFLRDRTWCWWSVRPTRWDTLATHRWTSWRAHGPSGSVRHESRQHPYLHLPSDRFHVAAIEQLQRSGRADLRLGTTATGTTTGARTDGGAASTDRAWIETTTGALGPFETVFDGRPPAPGDDGLVQRFVGHEVRTDRAIFDPATVELMDFRVSQADGPHFMYVLPFAADHALVESTRLVRPGAGEPDWDAAIGGWLADHGVSMGAVDILRTERGAIPMRSIRAPHGPLGRVCPIGTAAGIVKPSTGYAFASIQRWSAAMAESLATDAVPMVPPARGRAAEAMDRLMVSLLRRSPEIAPDVLVRVLRGLGADRTARFLGDHGRPADLLAAVRATPARPMTGHVLRLAMSGGAA
jgi:lycopene beta-cyclase